MKPRSPRAGEEIVLVVRRLPQSARNSRRHWRAVVRENRLLHEAVVAAGRTATSRSTSFTALINPTTGITPPAA